MGITLTVIIIGFLIGIIPTNVGKCGDNAFKGCKKIENIQLGDME
ncbi:MAG: hypothetical protein ACLU33_01755 [Christensenellales bacterium]